MPIAPFKKIMAYLFYWNAFQIRISNSYLISHPKNVSVCFSFFDCEFLLKIFWLNIRSRKQSREQWKSVSGEHPSRTPEALSSFLTRWKWISNFKFSFSLGTSCISISLRILKSSPSQICSRTHLDRLSGRGVGCEERGCRFEFRHFLTFSWRIFADQPFDSH